MDLSIVDLSVVDLYFVEESGNILWCPDMDAKTRNHKKFSNMCDVTVALHLKLRQLNQG